MRNIRIGSLLIGVALSAAFDMALLSVTGCAGSNPDYQTPITKTDGGIPEGPHDLQGVTCSAVPQLGCPLGQKCTTHDTFTYTCDPDGNANRGERCTTSAGVDNCFAGNVCTNAGNNTGVCRAFCRTDSDCGKGGYCELPLGTGGIRVCTQPCNALGAGCATGLACYAYDHEHTDCRLPGTGTEGQPCVRSEDCQPTMACLGPAAASRCRFLCQRGFSSDCPGNELCYTITNANDGSSWQTYGDCM